MNKKIDHTAILNHFLSVDRPFHDLAASLPPDVFAVELPVGASRQRLRLYRIIVGQQLSTRAAAAIWNRVETLLSNDPGINDPEALIAAGVSRSKTSYLRNLAEVDIGELIQLPEPEMRQKLLTVKGVGQWTVDMFAISVRGESDIFSWHDLGLRRAASLFWQLPPADEDALRAKVDKLSPYRTAAALILWHWYDRQRQGSA